MPDHTSGQVNQVKPNSLESLGNPFFAQHKTLHDGVKVQGQDHDPPPGRVLPEVTRGQLAAGQVVFHHRVRFFALPATLVKPVDQL